MAKADQESMDLIRSEISKFIPQLSINCVIFKFNGSTLQVAVVQPLNAAVWTIPGGFIYINESIDEAAKRTLVEQTQLEGLMLSQFGTFGASDRAFGKEIETYLDLGIPKELVDFISQRFITVGYYSIIGDQEIDLKPGPFFRNVKWADVKNRHLLALDHSLLVTEALHKLRAELQSQPLLLSFMPDTFTIPELQKLYETVLERPIDRGNFRQRMLKSKILTRIGTSTLKTTSRPPILYALNKEKYLNSLTQDVKLGF